MGVAENAGWMKATASLRVLIALGAFVSGCLQKFSVSQIEELLKRSEPAGVYPKAQEMGTERYRKPTESPHRGRGDARKSDLPGTGKSEKGTNRCGLLRGEFQALSGFCSGRMSKADRHRHGPSRDPAQESLDAWASPLL